MMARPASPLSKSGTQTRFSPTLHSGQGQLRIVSGGRRPSPQARSRLRSLNQDPPAEKFVTRSIKKAAANGDLCRKRRRVGGAAERRSERLELISRHLAASAVLSQLVAQFLAFVQIPQSGALHRADMDEGVGSAVIGLNEAEAFLGVEPFHGSGSHCSFSKHGKARTRWAGRSMFGEEVVSGFVKKQGQVVRPNIDFCNLAPDHVDYKLCILALAPGLLGEADPGD